MNRILVTDDNAQSRYMLESLLKYNGFEVDSAEDGQKALEVARKHRPDLIVTDILMPVMDGFMLCREVKKDRELANIPFIFYTATYTDAKDQELGLSLGADLYIFKPQEPSALLAQIREVLASSQGKKTREALVLGDEMDTFRRYNAVLFHKLEKKMRDLESINLKLKAAREDADQANRTKDLFLATLSHELRTPLTSILTWSQLLGAGRLNGDQVTKAAAAIQKSAWDQKRLVDDLLDLARITSGRLLLEPVPVDAAELIMTETEKFRSDAQDKGINMTSELKPLPSCALLDPLRVGQILTNLLKNAIKFTPRGGHIKIEMGPRDSWIRILVADTGIGLDPDQLNSIFEPFSQASSSTNRTHGGLGIGLTIVRNLVMIMGGKVRAESQGRGKGAKFEVMIPYLPAVKAVRSTGSQPPRISAAELKGLRIVLVDDDIDTLRSLTALFESCGMLVEACSGASEALNVVLRRSPDLIISDIAMPGEDGYSLITKLRTLQREKTIRDFPAVALTALADKQTRDKALSSGFDACASKPVEFEKLIEILSSLMRKRSPLGLRARA